jgi:hypothetical protein
MNSILDPFFGRKDDLAIGMYNGVEVTPADGVLLPTTSRMIWVGGAGNLAVMLAGDTEPVTLAGVAAGTMLPLRVHRVMATNTTATNIVALW